jgi:choline-sulfatase
MQPEQAQPNIIFIMSDEHDPGVTGCYGDPVIETPNLDRLAREGVTFDACYTTSPLCVPARLSFTAGKYVSRCGAWNNTCRLASNDMPSVPRVLQGAGYETFLCGKQHYDRNRRYGFTDILPEVSSNNSVKRGRLERRRADDTTPNLKSWEGRSANFHPGEDSGIMNHDRMVTRRTCEFLENWNGNRQPFFLFVGHLAPHFPLIAPQAIHEKYRGRVPPPDIPEGLIESLPLNYQQLRYGFGKVNIDPEVVQRGRELYWALTDWYDGQIGQILDTLDQCDFRENTVVVYTSDHGENKGDHGLWWKNNMFEHSARIPLIVRWPRRWTGGQRRAGACSLVDVVQTVCGLAGADVPADWDGDSMLDWLDTSEAKWKDRALSEYYGHNIASGIVMLRQGSWKYVYHTRADSEHGPEHELYNLNEDPQEFRNLATDPAQQARMAEMHAAMLDELPEDPDETELRYRRERAETYADVDT